MRDADKKDDLDAIDRVKNMELQEKEMREGFGKKVWKLLKMHTGMDCLRLHNCNT